MIAKAVLFAAHSLPLCNFSQNKVAVMTWRAWVMCSCISIWARCPGRASRLPPSAKSTRGSARKRCQRPSRCSAKGTLVSALILMAVLSAAWLAHLLKPPGILNPKEQCNVSDQDVLLTWVIRRITEWSGYSSGSEVGSVCLWTVKPYISKGMGVLTNVSTPMPLLT